MYYIVIVMCIIYIYIYLYYIATRCLCVCVFAAYLLRNGWTDLAKLFFVSSVLVTGRFLAKKIPDPGSGSGWY